MQHNSAGHAHQSHPSPVGGGISPQQSSASSRGESPRSPPQRVHSQTLYDRQSKGAESQSAMPNQRPNTAQGIRVEDDPAKSSISSLSHTETSV